MRSRGIWRQRRVSYYLIACSETFDGQNPSEVLVLIEMSMKSGENSYVTFSGWGYVTSRKTIRHARGNHHKQSGGNYEV
jgi:hypothetical protein